MLIGCNTLGLIGFLRARRCVGRSAGRHLFHLDRLEEPEGSCQGLLRRLVAGRDLKASDERFDLAPAILGLGQLERTYEGEPDRVVR
jgi:hypothetical protein